MRWKALGIVGAWCALVVVGLQATLLTLSITAPAFASNIGFLGIVHAVLLGGFALAFFALHRPLLVDQSVGGGGFLSACGINTVPLRFLLLGGGLALAVKFPAEWLRQVVESFSPTPEAERLAQLALLRHDTPLQVVLLVLVVAVVGPWFEELLYRGCFFRMLERQTSATAAVGFTTVTFAFAHAAFRDWASLLLVALVLGGLRRYTASLWPSYVMHATFNGMTLLSLMLSDTGGAT